VALSNCRDDENPIHHTDTQLSEKLRSSMRSIFEEDEEKLRKLKDVKTLINTYKRTRDYKQQANEEGIYSLLVNKMTEELLGQLEPYYRNSIVNNIQIQTRFKKEKGTVEVDSKIDLKASLKPYVEFIIEVNGRKSFLIRFIFQIETSAHVTKLKFTKNADEGKSIHIEKIGINIELFLLRIEFSDEDTPGTEDISFDKKMKLGSKRFEIHDLYLYARPIDKYNNAIACPKCNTMNSPESKICINCFSNL
jgi:hypothetical protein